MTAPNPIPTQLNIAPRGKRWKDWQLVDSEIGFPTREAMEKYHCHPERVQALEEERLALLESNRQLNQLNDRQTAQIKELEAQIEAIGAGGVEPLRKPVQAVEPELVVEMSRKIAELQDQLAAVQQGVQPPFMYAIADGYGQPFFEEEGCVSSEAKDLQSEVDSLNQNLDGEPPYKVVALYTQQGLDAREFPAMTPELASILGLMCFQCIPFAQALRAGGQQINTRAEDEQAAVLHWMLGHYFRHGEAWRDAAAEDMERMKADAVAAQAKQGGV